jgi:hypothetical protein
MAKIRKKTNTPTPIKGILSGNGWAVYGDSNGNIKIKFYDLEIDIKL